VFPESPGLDSATTGSFILTSTRLSVSVGRGNELSSETLEISDSGKACVGTVFFNSNPVVFSSVFD